MEKDWILWEDVSILDEHKDLKPIKERNFLKRLI